MQNKYPFKFLDTYTRDDIDFYFGRDEEIAQMYNMVFQTNLLLVYGSSGVGKSSLIQCGLASKFDTHDWQSIFVRRGSDINESLEKSLIEAGGDINDNDGLDWLDQDWTATDEQQAKMETKSVLGRRINAIHLKNFKPIYLIFDQFEELYIFGSEDERKKFYQSIKDLTTNETNVKIIILIREEYLGYLYEFEKVIPQLLRKKIRVEPMNISKVTDIVKGLSASKNSLVTIRKGEEERFAEQVFDRLKGDENKITIELPYLQVFFDKLYLSITHDETRQTPAEFSLESLNNIGDIGDILRNLLDEQVDQLVNKCNLPAETIWKFLSSFVSLDGTKDPKSLDDIIESVAKYPDFPVRMLLNELVSRRILRKNRNEMVYEIAHDSLAKQISLKRSDDEIAILEIKRMIHSSVSIKEESREYFTEKQLAFITPLLDKMKITPEERDWLNKSEAHVRELHEEEERRKNEKLRRARKRLRQTLVVLVIMVIAFAYAVLQSFVASRAQQKSEILLADNQRAIALYQMNIGDSLRLTRACATMENIVENLVPRAEDYGYLGTCYFKLGERDKALEQYNLCLKEAEKGKRYEERYFSDSVSQSKLRTQMLPRDKAISEAHRLLAHYYYENHDFQQAYSHACEAVKAYDKDYDAWYDVSKYALYVDKYDESIDAANEALTLNKKQFEVEKYMALAYAMKGDLDEAEAIYNKYFNTIFHSQGTLYTKNTMLTYDTTWRYSTPMFFEGINLLRKNNITSEHIDFVANLLNDKLAQFISEIEMVDVEGGEFTMGNTTDPNAVAHQVIVSDFKIGKFEVTQQLWQTIMGYNPSACQESNMNPVEKITWYEAEIFIERLNKVTGLNFRLPTEAEWEYAAMGGKKTHHYTYSGFDDIAGNANYKSKTKADLLHPIKVGSYKPNELGIYDMCGNVWEWCSDWFAVYSESYKPQGKNQGWDTTVPLVNPTGKLTEPGFDFKFEDKVMRGGSFDSEKGRCAVKNRHHHHPSIEGQFYGMRLVQSVE